jgi:hypothetical protein
MPSNHAFVYPVLSNGSGAANSAPASFVGITLTPGMSIADTPAQNGVMGLKAFLAHEKILFHQFGLKVVRALSDVNPVGIGGSTKVLGRFCSPVGIGNINGMILYTVVDDRKVPPLTPISTLHLMGAVIDIPGNEIHFTKCGGASTKMSTIASGHRQHSLLEFGSNGWKASGRKYGHPHGLAI